MLTHTDVHLLVGMLSLVTSPDDVEVELGSLVRDEASESDRDVDVTITTRNSDGTRRGYGAIEVKDETKPLDVQAVEQLIAKLGDMPSITQSSIVSSSGYSKAARKKAARHHVELLRFRDWRRGERVFPFLNPNLEAALQLDMVGWAQPPSLTIITEKGTPDIPLTSIVLVGDGRTMMLGQLLLTLRDGELTRLNEAGEFSSLTHGETRQITLEIDVEKPLKVSSNATTVRVCGFRLAGEVFAIKRRDSFTMKLLVNDETDLPDAACMVGLLPNGDLFGAVFKEDDINPHLIKIPISDRNLKVIRELKLPKRRGH
jgi:hypothetical protein